MTKPNELVVKLEELSSAVAKTFRGFQYPSERAADVLHLMQTANAAMDLANAYRHEELRTIELANGSTVGVAEPTEDEQVRGADYEEDDDLLDADGYPTEATFEKVKTWSYLDFKGLVRFVHSLWWPDQKWGWNETITDGVTRLELATGGWSGNETLISALQGNAMFWLLCWRESRRGGHYVFEVPTNA